MREHDAFSIRNYDDVFAVQRELQLMGLTCVFMAAKIEEVHPPKATDLATYISEQGAVNCSGDDLVRYEGEYLVVRSSILLFAIEYARILMHCFPVCVCCLIIGAQLEPASNDLTFLAPVFAGR